MPKFSFNMLQLVNKTGLTQHFLYSQISYDKEHFKNFKIIIPAIISQHYRQFPQTSIGLLRHLAIDVLQYGVFIHAVLVWGKKNKSWNQI